MRLFGMGKEKQYAIIGSREELIGRNVTGPIMTFPLEVKGKYKKRCNGIGYELAQNHLMKEAQRAVRKSGFSEQEVVLSIIDIKGNHRDWRFDDKTWFELGGYYGYTAKCNVYKLSD